MRERDGARGAASAGRPAWAAENGVAPYYDFGFSPDCGTNPRLRQKYHVAMLR